MGRHKSPHLNKQDITGTGCHRCPVVIPSWEYLHHTAHVKDVIHKLEKFADVISDGGCVGVHLPQVLLIDLADTLKMVTKGLQETSFSH